MLRLACLSATAALVATVCSATARECLRATAPLAAGEVPDASHFVPAQCPATVQSAFRYDHATRDAHATRAIAEGDMVPAFVGYRADGVHAGQAIVVVYHDGPIAVERRVVALQAARKGQNLFVRAEGGDVFPVSYESIVR